jgi:hypothetical protein
MLSRHIVGRFIGDAGARGQIVVAGIRKPAQERTPAVQQHPYSTTLAASTILGRWMVKVR